MRAEFHAELARALRGVRHRCVIADVAAARDVRRRDERPDLVFARRAFAEVCANVDHSVAPFVSGRSQMSAPATAKKSASMPRSSGKPRRGRSAPIANGANAEKQRPAL